jgi:hypothetical protein
VSDGFLAVVAVVIMALVPGDLYAAVRLLVAAVERPAIPALTLYAGLSCGVAIAAAAFGIIALSTFVRILTGEALLPTGFGLPLLLVGMVVISLPNVFLLRQLRRWDAE